ncbi:hypothetical protein J6590_040093 [Homalodisca vitripennis]|nr:hypothetical protein J6590_040093 [Homalodisca vitripennis]
MEYGREQLALYTTGGLVVTGWCIHDEDLVRVLAQASQIVPMSEWSKTLDFESELEIAHVRILSVILALFISTIDLVLYRLSPLFCLIRSSHRPVAYEDGQNKA